MWSPFLATGLIWCYFFGLFAQDVTVDYMRGFGLVFFFPCPALHPELYLPHLLC